MASGSAAWIPSTVSSSAMGKFGWRDKVQTQSSPSRMRRRTIQFGTSNSSKRNVASVHAPASASFSSAATLSNWRRDLSRAHPRKTLRNKRAESVGADRQRGVQLVEINLPDALH